MKPQAANLNPVPDGRAWSRDSQARELEDAFHTFNKLYEDLSKSYQALEIRVAEMTTELAAARSERLAQLAEKELLANRLARLHAALPAGVLDGEGRVQECNPAALALLGEPLRGEAWRDVIVRAFAPRSDDGHEISLRDGRLVSIATSPLGIEPGQILLLTDVTGTRQLQERLNRHKRLSAMGEMAASLAHQIRTPLASTLLYASHLSRPLLDLPDRVRIAGKIQSRMHHLEQLVNDMLLFAKGGSIGTDVVVVDDLMSEAQKIFEPGLLAQGCRIEVVNETSGAALRGNREALLSAMQNLVSNAQQACGEGGQIGLRACHASGQTGIHAVDIMVSDDGPGIAEDVQGKLFEPFFTTRNQGTGLGLAVVRAIAEAHQGIALVRSSPGKGSTFVMRLPLISDARENTMAQAAGVESESARRSGA